MSPIAENGAFHSLVMRIEPAKIQVNGINLTGEMRIPAEGSAFPSLCICHGIPSGQPPDPTDGGYPVLAEKFTLAGLTTLIFNFRGTGASGGNFDMLGWTEDLRAAIEYLSRRMEVDRSRIFVMGFSGGAAASAYVAAHDTRVSGLVLCACPAGFRGFDGPDKTDFSIQHFREIGLIRDRGFPTSIERWRDGFRKVTPLDWIDRISPRPLLIVHGQADELIDVNDAWRLYERAREPKEIAVIEGAGHRLRRCDKAMNLALQWLLRHLSLQ